MMLHKPFLVLVLATLASSQVIPSSESVTFSSRSDFIFIRSCGICCFQRYLGCTTGGVAMTEVLGCTINSCLCRRNDIRLTASAYLTACVNSACSATEDVDVAISVYDGYCNAYIGQDVTPTETVREPTPTNPTRNTSNTPVSTQSDEPTNLPPQTTTFVSRTSSPGDSDPNTNTNDRDSQETVTVTQTAAASTGGSVPNTNANGQDSQGTVTVTQTAVAVSSGSGFSEGGKIGLGVGLGLGVPLLVAVIVYYHLKTVRNRLPEMPEPIQGPYVN